MHWTELQKQVSNFPEDQNYFQALEQLKWDKPELLSRNIAICCDFLGESIDKQKVEKVFTEVVALLADCVEPIFLERHGMLKVEDKKEHSVYCAGQAIQKMYEAMASIAGLDTATGILHLRFPNLFVTTDEAIRKYWLEEIKLHERYSVNKTELFGGYGYTFILLPFIKSQAVDAIMTCANDKGVNPKEAIAQLQNLGGKTRSIARLMDEYYRALSR